MTRLEESPVSACGADGLHHLCSALGRAVQLTEIDDGNRYSIGGERWSERGRQDEFGRDFDHVGSSVNKVLHALEQIGVGAAAHFCAKTADQNEWKFWQMHEGMAHDL